MKPVKLWMAFRPDDCLMTIYGVTRTKKDMVQRLKERSYNWRAYTVRRVTVTVTAPRSTAKAP